MGIIKTSSIYPQKLVLLIISMKNKLIESAIKAANKRGTQKLFFRYFNSSELVSGILSNRTLHTMILIKHNVNILVAIGAPIVPMFRKQA